MSATSHHLDRPTSKKFDQWVFWPIPCVTGALHLQPSLQRLNLLACGEFTADFKVFFDLRGAMDAPDVLPSGGVRAHDFERHGDVAPLRLMVAEIGREGVA